MKLLHSITFSINLEIFQQVQRYKSLFAQTSENTENKKSYCALRRLLIRMK